MTATVRFFAHDRLAQAPKASYGAYATDSVSMLNQPYLNRASLTVTTGTAQSTPGSLSTHAKTTLLQVQVQQGKAVHIEVNPEHRSVQADTGSPIVTGTSIFQFGPNWSVSILEADLS